MNKYLRFATLAVASLVVAAPAGAAGPTLSVEPASSILSTAVSTVLRFADDGTNPTVSIEVYVPAGYRVDLSQPPGTVLGSNDAHGKTAAGSEVRLAGAVKAADPTAYVDEAAACTGQPVHDAVWTIGLNGEGLSLPRLVAFVDRGSADDSEGTAS